jgi:hypothetical protein
VTIKAAFVAFLPGFESFGSGIFLQQHFPNLMSLSRLRMSAKSKCVIWDKQKMCWSESEGLMPEVVQKEYPSRMEL